MANFTYRGLGSYMKSKDQLKEEAGFDWCSEHLKYFDPKRFKQCYFCFLDKNKSKAVS